MKRILTKRWIARATTQEFTKQLSAGRLVKDEHLLAILGREDWRMLTTRLAALGHVPWFIADHHLESDGSIPSVLLETIALEGSTDLVNVLTGASRADLQALVRNPHLDEDQLGRLYAESQRPSDPDLATYVEFRLALHPNLGPDVMAQVLAHRGGELSLGFRFRPQAMDKENSRWAEPLTFLRSTDGVERLLDQVLARPHLSPSEGMSPSFLQERFPGFLHQTCVRRGLDPDVATVLAQEWDESSEDFYEACAELGPQAR